jgi:hypothetical protein
VRGHSLRYEDPADVAAIEEAEQNMGDFKLKSDPAYVVPEVRELVWGIVNSVYSPIHVIRLD